MHTGVRIPRDKSTELHSSYLVFVLDVASAEAIGRSLFSGRPQAVGAVLFVEFFSSLDRKSKRRFASARLLSPSSSLFRIHGTRKGGGMRAQKYHFLSTEQVALPVFSLCRHNVSAFEGCMSCPFDKSAGKAIARLDSAQKGAHQLTLTCTCFLRMRCPDRHRPTCSFFALPQWAPCRRSADRSRADRWQT